MIPRPTHGSATMEPETARALFENRRTDMLNAWRQYVRSVTRREVAEEVIGTASAMAQMADV